MSELKQQEVEEDLQERVESLNKELIQLLGKYELGLTCVMSITPDGRIGARPSLVSARKPAEEAKVVEA